MVDEPKQGEAAASLAIDATNPEVAALIAAAVKESNAALEANRNEILGEAKTLKQQVADMTKTWDGLDPEAVRNIMGRMENDEETKLLAEGKMDEVIERRTERLKADYGNQIENLTKTTAEKDAALESAQGRIKGLMVEGSLRSAASELGLIPSAVDDALHRAMNVFSVNDKNKLIAKDADGSTIFGKDGKNPISPAEWLDTMKESAPHWFPAPNGAGAGGGQGRGGSHTITREQARNVPVYRAAKDAAEKAGASLQIVG
jgi:hypothetical protein